MSSGPSWLAWRAATTPHATAIELPDGRRVSWLALGERAESVASGLAARGVGPDSVVAARLGNDPDFAALLFACERIGARLLPLHERHTADELGFALNDAEASLLVHREDADASATAAADGAEFTDIAALVKEGRRPAPTPECDDARPLVLLYTSGTTGPPKGVVLTRGNFFWSAVGSAAHLGAPARERWLACMPLFHVGGIAILVRAVLFGSTVVLHPRFDVAAVSRSLAADGITLASFVPTMLRRLLDAPGTLDAPNLRCILSGGAATPPGLLEEAWSAGMPVLPTYGLTEACSQVATLPPSAIGGPSDVAGRALLGTEITIRDSAGRALDPGEAGEICVRGPTVMKGYWRRPADTAAALRAGWLHTGDVGSLDQAGLLRVLDRRSDLIVSGGENVYPAEVESVLERHPGVAEAGVRGAGDRDLGQRVVAWVVPADSADPPRTEALAHFCRQHLAAYKVPRSIRIDSTLPRTASGKLQRSRLR